jgi:hypothetical protein
MSTVFEVNKKMIAVCALCACLMAGTAVEAAVPSVVFPTAFGPGVQLPFSNNDSVVDYGFVKTSFGWAFDTFQGNDLGDALARFVPTLQGPGALTPMGEADDWVYHMEFSHVGPYGANDFFMNAKAEPGFAGTDPSSTREQRIFAVDYLTDGTWNLKAGDATGGGWANVATGLVMDAYVDFDVHYRADAAVMDFYWDGALVGTAPTGHGRYDIDLIQFEEVIGSGTTSVRNIRLGHIEAIPEPASVLLLALGAVGMLATRHRR